MFRPSEIKLAALFALVLVACVLVRPLLPIDETRYLDVAWEMYLTGDHVHLTRNFELYAHKPPLLFWLIDLVWMAGVSEFAARLVGPACAVLCVLATARLARRIWPEDAGVGLRSAAILAGFVAFVLYGSTTMFDALLTVAVLIGIGALWSVGTGAQKGARGWLLFGFALGFGILAKGPVIFLHLLPPLLLLPLWAARPPAARQMFAGLVLALATAAAIVALWLVPALLGGDRSYQTELLWTQSAARVTGGMAHDRPLWFLVVLLPLLLFPWGWNLRYWRALPPALRADNGLRLGLIWAVSAIVLFSLLASKQLHYLLPELPALALVLARLSATPEAQPSRLVGATVLVGMAGVVGLLLSATMLPGALPGLSAGAGAALSAGLLLLALCAAALRGLGGQMILGWGVALLLHVGFAASGAEHGYDARVLATRLAPATEAGLAYYGDSYNGEVNFALRLRQPVATPGDAAALSDWAQHHPDGLIFGPLTGAALKEPPVETVRFNGRDLGIWRAGSALSVPG